MTRAVLAPAKVNLALHVTGRRPDGYHLLDSLVTFADVGDQLTFAADDQLVLNVQGPEAAALADAPDNLILRAARCFGPTGQGARITLDKRLPVASGIGGGSADAAATVRALARMWGRPHPDPADLAVLGADVPVCVLGRSCRMGGIGAELAPVPQLPPLWAVLANPRIAGPTPAVFAALTCREGAPMPASLPRWTTAPELASWLVCQRNDLELPARSIAPEISSVLERLSVLPEVLLSRMSGSGATCFGLFASAAAATRAADLLRRACPAWWVVSTALGDADPAWA